NIGSTVTAQIIAFKVTRLSLPIIALGFALASQKRRPALQHYGAGIMGLGLVFLGINVMGDAMSPLRSYPPFLDAMTKMDAPLLGILAGAIFTGLVHSSAATTGIVIVMASQGLISLEAGIAIALGANIGTCVTAVLAAVGKPREALRASLVHVLFNVVGVILWFGFIDRLADLAAWVSPSAADLTGTARVAAEAPRQIANAHTIFNVVNTILFLPLATQFARIAERLVPERPMAEEEIVRARYLDTELVATPSLALDRVRLEILRLGERVADMLDAILPAVLTGQPEELLAIQAMDDGVDALHASTVTYLGKVSQQKLTAEETDELINLMEAVNSLENIGDVIETNLVTLGLHRIATGVNVSRPTAEILTRFHRSVRKALDASLQAATQRSGEAAAAVRGMKAEINEQTDQARRHQAARLVADEPDRIAAYTLETDVLQNLQRIYYYTRRMARTVLASTRNAGA
ncbi:MAG: Na/Pi cotransporter family protein, partial [Acidobacteriota bacterium]|nr:Na/Pi cotransporter family protein [Acidobacteriota bacterium]